jgi:hypothetical protein
MDYLMRRNDCKSLGNEKKRGPMKMKTFYLCHLVLISGLAVSLGAQPAFSDEKKVEVKLKGGAYSGREGDGLSAGIDMKTKIGVLMPIYPEIKDQAFPRGLLAFTPRVRGSLDLDTDAKQVSRAEADLTLGSFFGIVDKKNNHISVGEVGYMAKYNRALNIREVGMRGTGIALNLENDFACINARLGSIVFTSHTGQTATILSRENQDPDGIVVHPAAASVCGKLKVGEKGDTVKLSGSVDGALINSGSNDFGYYTDMSINLAYEKIKGTSWTVEATGSRTFSHQDSGYWESYPDARLLVGASKAY